jgi:hypothetical protein
VQSRPSRSIRSHGGGHRFDTCRAHQLSQQVRPSAHPGSARLYAHSVKVGQQIGSNGGRSTDGNHGRPTGAAAPPNRRGLFLWETFVTGAAKTATHIGDAMVAAEAFLEALLPNLPARNTVHEERVLSLIAAAALWSGITSNATLLNSSCVVLHAAERRRRPGNG